MQLKTRNRSYRLAKGGGKGAYQGLETFWNQRIWHEKTKLRIYVTVIRRTVTYASETWVLNTKEENQLLVWERKFLRGIF